MLRETIELLQGDDFYGESEFIEIAKGKNKIPNTWKEISNQFIRELKCRLRKL